MKVLHVSHALAPDSFGGAELHLRDLVRQQSATHQLMVLAREAGGANEQYALRDELREGVRVRLFVNTFADVWRDGFERTYLNPRISAIFAGALEEFRPDVVHLHHLTALSSDLPMVARAMGVPSVLTLYDFWPFCHRGNLVDRRGRACDGPELKRCSTCVADQLLGAGSAPWLGGMLARAHDRPWFEGVRRAVSPLARLALRRPEQKTFAPIERRQRALREALEAVDLLLAPSQSLRARYVAEGFSDGRILHSPLGFPATPSVPRVAARQVRIGFIGRLSPIKGLHLLLSAARSLPKQEYYLHVFGQWHDDPTWPRYESAMRSLAADLPVAFEGAFPDGQVFEVMSRLDLLVVPSLARENAPRVVYEARLAGVPLIGSDVEGVAEIIAPRRDGWIFPSGDTNALRALLAQAIQDPPRLRAMKPDRDSVRSLQVQCAELDRHYARLAGRLG